MRLLVASDLHVEFHADRGRSMVDSLADADVFVCAGDLSTSRGIWDALLLVLRKYKHVVFVFGNHEFYGSNIQAVRQKIARLQARLEGMPGKYGQLHVLDNSTCEIEGQRFVGTTLWVRHTPDIEALHGRLTDFFRIGNAHVRVYEENEVALRFLESTVGPQDIVITHHLPASPSVDPIYEDSDINCFFLCDVEDLIRDRQPSLWVHGHTHQSISYTIGNTKVVCNPFGYAAEEENPQFDSQLVIEV